MKTNWKKKFEEMEENYQKFLMENKNLEFEKMGILSRLGDLEKENSILKSTMANINILSAVIERERGV